MEADYQVGQEIYYEMAVGRIEALNGDGTATISLITELGIRTVPLSSLSTSALASAQLNKPPASPAAPKAKKVKIKNGEVVMAKGTYGTFYRGKVTAVYPNGTYAVLFDDGSLRQFAPAEDVIPLNSYVPPKPAESMGQVAETSSNNFSVGDTVAAKFRGDFFLGTIKAVNEIDGEKRYAVYFEDGSFLNSVSAENVRAFSPARKEEIIVGDLVKAKWKGRRSYSGKIFSVNDDGTYGVLFEESFFDVAVPRRDVDFVRRGRPIDRDTRTHFYEGDSVLAEHPKKFVYSPAIITSVTKKEGHFSVKFEDGTSAAEMSSEKIMFVAASVDLVGDEAIHQTWDLEVGQVVEYQDSYLYENEWNIYKIRRRNVDGTYDVISIVNENIYMKVEPRVLRPLPEPNYREWKVGDRVMARCNHYKFEPAKIEMVYTEGRFKVAFEDFGTEVVPYHYMRLVESVGPAIEIPKFERGDKVRVNLWRNNPTGTVTFYNEGGTYAVVMDSGDFEPDVDPKELELLSRQPAERDYYLKSYLDAPEDVETFLVGDAVRARWRGHTYHSGTIAAANGDNTYVVEFKEKPKESKVPAKDIVLVKKAVQEAEKPPPGGFKVGDPVDARFKGGDFYTGWITKVNGDGTYAVSFDDGGEESREPEGHIRLALATASRSTSPCQVGMKVLAKWRDNEYYVAKIMMENFDGTYAVKFIASNNYISSVLPASIKPYEEPLSNERNIEIFEKGAKVAEIKGYKFTKSGQILGEAEKKTSGMFRIWVGGICAGEWMKDNRDIVKGSTKIAEWSEPNSLYLNGKKWLINGEDAWLDKVRLLTFEGLEDDDEEGLRLVASWIVFLRAH